MAAAMELERRKVGELQRKEEEKRAKIEAKRQRKESELRAARERAGDEEDRERLRQWQEAELHRERLEVSDQMLCDPPEALRVATDEEDTGGAAPQRRIPLRYFSRNRLVAWEYPGPGGVGVTFAPLIGVAAGAVDSDDEW